MPRYEQEGCEVADDEDGVLEHHLQTGHDRVLHLVHVATHTGDDVALALFAEESHGQGGDLPVELVPHITYHTRTDRQDAHGSKIVDTRLQGCGHSQEYTYQQQGGGLSPFSNETVHVVVHIVHQHRLYVRPIPRHQTGGGLCITRLEEDLQDGDQGRKREYIQHSRQDVEHDAEDQVFLIRRHKPPEYAEKFFHILF